MRRLFAIAVLLPIAGVCCAAPASAELHGQYATQTFVVARYIETRAVNTVLNTGLAGMEAHASQIAHECPGVLLNAPAGADKSALSVELEFSVLLSLYQPLRAPINGFTGAMVEDRLRWHDKALQRLVYAYVREQIGFLALHPPDICGDARAWAAGGFTTLPSGAKRFAGELRHLAHAESDGTDSRLTTVLRRHTTRPERVVLARTARLQATQADRVTRRLTAALDAAVAALGVPAIGPVVVHPTGQGLS